MASLKIALYILSAFSFLTVLLPFIRKDHWFFRVFDYPRLQKFALIGVLGIGWLFYRNDLNRVDYVILAILSMSFIYLGWLIVPFTPLGKKMIKKADGDPTNTISVLVSNVYQKNKQYNRLVSYIGKMDPDVIFLLETDRLWQQGVARLKEDYPYSIEVPQENTYGLLFFSRLPIKNYEIMYLVDKEIPSIIADVSVDGRSLRIFGLHPTPPVPHENDHSTERDAEILLVGKMAKKHDGPCLVIGDLNDVAWSYTTKLFLKVSGLLDPRRGRGLYSTFHASYWLLRWPLDHFFVSGHFRLNSISVGDNIGSDHFPISISLALSAEDDSRKLKKDSEDAHLAEKKIDAGLKNEPL